MSLYDYNNPSVLRKPLNEALRKIMDIYQGLEFETESEMHNFEHYVRYHIGRIQRGKERVVREKDLKRLNVQREQKKKLNNRCEDWITKHGFPGLYIKVTGSRDGRGYREIISMNRNNKTMKCYQLDRYGERMQIVEIMFNKFRGVLYFGEYVDAGRRAYVKNLDNLEKIGGI